jgi:hypothetical protein
MIVNSSVPLLTFPQRRLSLFLLSDIVVCADEPVEVALRIQDRFSADKKPLPVSAARTPGRPAHL